MSDHDLIREAITSVYNPVNPVYVNIIADAVLAAIRDRLLPALPHVYAIDGLRNPEDDRYFVGLGVMDIGLLNGEGETFALAIRNALQGA